MAKPKIAIIGAGNVGLSFAQLFIIAGYDISVGVRETSLHRKRKQLSTIPTPMLNTESLNIKTSEEAVGNADVCLLTVPDGAIKSACDNLCDHYKKGAIITHCSGLLTSTTLTSASEVGCRIASAHPLNSFPSLEASLTQFKDINHGTYLYFEGEKTALKTLSKLFIQLGFIPTEIATESKTLYHTACVFACNYLNSLMELSFRTAESAGLNREQFKNAIQPLLQTTFDNILKFDTAKSLSGPIARGDAISVAHHLEGLSNLSPILSDNYVELGKQALQLALSNGTLTSHTAREIENLLDSHSSKHNH